MCGRSRLSQLGFTGNKSLIIQLKPIMSWWFSFRAGSHGLAETEQSNGFGPRTMFWNICSSRLCSKKSMFWNIYLVDYALKVTGTPFLATTVTIFSIIIPSFALSVFYKTSSISIYFFWWLLQTTFALFFQIFFSMSWCPISPELTIKYSSSWIVYFNSAG